MVKIEKKLKLSMVTLIKDNINIPLQIGKNIIYRQRTQHGRFTSRKHCTIYVKEKRNRSIILMADHSTNGTYVNECFVKNNIMLLSVNDKIGLGSTLESFHLKVIDSVDVN